MPPKLVYLYIDGGVMVTPSDGQTTVQYCIGGHANILFDYKKTGPPKFKKNFHRDCPQINPAQSQLGSQDLVAATATSHRPATVPSKVISV